MLRSLVGSEMCIRDSAYLFSITATNVQTLSRITRDTLSVTLSYHTALNGGRELGEDRELIFSRTTALPTGAEIITNIASYDAAQNRFEDSSGNAVTPTPGAIVITTQAIYDAAVADSFAFPATVIFLTSA